MVYVAGQTPQSAEQEEQVSVPKQRLSPQVIQVPQSAEQEEQVSVPPQMPLPQTSGGGGQTPQSAEQEEQVSPASQVLLPQVAGGGQEPQSLGQLLHVSAELQELSPQY